MHSKAMSLRGGATAKKGEFLVTCSAAAERAWDPGTTCTGALEYCKSEYTKGDRLYNILLAGTTMHSSSNGMSQWAMSLLLAFASGIVFFVDCVMFYLMSNADADGNPAKLAERDVLGTTTREVLTLNFFDDSEFAAGAFDYAKLRGSAAFHLFATFGGRYDIMALWSDAKPEDSELRPAAGSLQAGSLQADIAAAGGKQAGWGDWFMRKMKALVIGIGMLIFYALGVAFGVLYFVLALFMTAPMLRRLRNAGEVIFYFVGYSLWVSTSLNGEDKTPYEVGASFAFRDAGCTCTNEDVVDVLCDPTVFAGPQWVYDLGAASLVLYYVCRRVVGVQINQLDFRGDV